MKLRKTIQIDLLEPTKKKKEIIEEGMKQTLEVMKETSKRMPSIPKYLLKKPKVNVYYNWVKDFRSDGISLYAQSVQEAVQKVREAYLGMYERKSWNKVPKYKKENLIVFHNQSFGIEKHNGRWYIECSIFPRNKISLPIKSGKFQEDYLESIKKDIYSYGASELVKYKDKYKFNLVVRKEVPKLEVENIKHIASIDLGLNSIAVLSIIDKDGKIKKVKFFSGGEASFLRQKCYNRRKDLQKAGKLKEIKKTRDYEKRWMKNLNHNISRKIVDVVKDFPKSIIVFEDLKNIRKTARERSDLKGRAKKKRNRMLSSWTFSKLKKYITYKARPYRIPVIDVEPAFTSQRCNKCGNTDKENRDGAHFHCLNCGYKVNADLNAAINIGKRAAGKLYAS